MSNPVVVGALQVLVPLLAAVVFLVLLLVGFCVVFGFPKLRKSGGKTLIVRSLGELVGERAVFLPPTAPRGPADQLKTPELLEVAARKSG